MRLSEAVNLKANDFNWEEETVIVLGKGNRYRKCLAGNGIVKQWFSEHNAFELSKDGAQTMLRRLKLRVVSRVMPTALGEDSVSTRLRVVYLPV